MNRGLALTWTAALTVSLLVAMAAGSVVLASIGAWGAVVCLDVVAPLLWGIGLEMVWA